MRMTGILVGVIYPGAGPTCSTVLQGNGEVSTGLRENGMVNELFVLNDTSDLVTWVLDNDCLHDTAGESEAAKDRVHDKSLVRSPTDSHEKVNTGEYTDKTEDTIATLQDGIMLLPSMLE